MFISFKKIIGMLLLGSFISLIAWSCGRQDSGLKQDNTATQPLDIIFEGASISQGIGASFSLSSRMQYFLKTNHALSEKISEKFSGKRIGFVFDYFFITNFPFWSSKYDATRIDLVRKELDALSNRFDVVFISELPSENMIKSVDSEKNRKKLIKELDHPELEFVRNQMSIGLVTKAASRNSKPHLVRDQINREIRLLAQREPQKFIKLDIDRFVNDMVVTSGHKKFVETNSGHKVGVKELYADHLHFNDLGQTMLLNRVLIPGLVNSATSETSSEPIPKWLNEDPNRFDASWRNDVKKKIYNTDVDFEHKKTGVYRLEFPSQRDFIKSATFHPGSDSSVNPLLSRFKLSIGLPKLMNLLIDKLDVSIPLWIKDESIILDMRKPIQSSIVSLNEVSAGHWVGYNRDYWLLTMAGFNTTYKFELIKSGKNEYQFKWTIFPLLKGQDHGFYRQDHVDNSVIDELESNAKSYHRLVLESKMSFSNEENSP